jgi:hypothetical protein
MAMSALGETYPSLASGVTALVSFALLSWCWSKQSVGALQVAIALFGVALLVAALRYRLLVVLAVILMALALGRLGFSAKASLRALVLLFTATLLLAAAPFDVTLRDSTGGLRIVAVEDGLWAGAPPNVDDDGVLGLACYGQNAPQWVLVW